MEVLAEPVPGLDGAHFAVVEIAGPIDESRLTPAERALFAALPGEGRRRREWFAGRMAARAALRACGAGAASILRAESGAPRLSGPHAEQAFVAITHGQTRAAAVATRADGRWPSVGVDLVDATDLPRIQRIAKRVLKPAELALAAEGEERLLLAWGAREAVAKATRTGMFLFALTHAWLEAVDTASGRLRVNVPGIEAGFRFLDDGSALVMAGADASALEHAARVVAARGLG